MNDFALTEQWSPARRTTLARADDTEPAVLLALAADTSGDIRWEVARRKYVPVAALALLARDPLRDVRLAVAQNSETPAEALAVLASDRDRDVRAWVACHLETPDEALAVLATDRSVIVRNQALRNPYTPIAVKIPALRRAERDKVAMSMTETDLYSVITSSQTPHTSKVTVIRELLRRGHQSDVIARFADSPDRKIRNALARVLAELLE